MIIPDCDENLGFGGSFGVVSPGIGNLGDEL